MTDPMVERLPLPMQVRILVPSTPCWIWDGTRTNKGYGTWQHTTAYRKTYEELVGPIPEGYEIDHLCKNPTCVNPEHLEAVTPEENNRRSNSLSAQRGRMKFCRLGHEFTIENTGRDGTRRRCLICKRAWMERRQAERAAS